MIQVTGRASTSSRRPARMLTGLEAVRCWGNKVQLADGRNYIDHEMGLVGPLYGYAPDWWRKAISKAVNNNGGTITSIVHKDEQVAADMLGMHYPHIEAVRWMSNGSDPCAAAVKLARAVTGKRRILVQGYHGWASAYCTPPDANARPGLLSIDMRRGCLDWERDAYVPLDWLEDLWADDVAAVVVECPPDDGGWDASRRWLHWLANTARINGALFVLDEVVTGFRYGPGGAAQYYEIEDRVDLYCFGKTIGNGFPIACLGGKAGIMNELCNGVHVSGTFFGFPMGLAAVKATMRELLDNPPWEHLGFMGRYLKEQWNAIDLPYKLIGHPTRPIIDDATIDDKFTDLRRHLFRRGHIIVDHPWFVSTATTKKDVDDLVDAAKEWAG